jgi:hypothetical protein
MSFSSNDGQPFAGLVGTQVTVLATITGVSGSGPTGTLTVKLTKSGNSVNVQAQDVLAPMDAAS